MIFFKASAPFDMQQFRFSNILSILFLSTIYSCTVLKPAAPETTAAEIPNIVQPVSTIDVPVTADLKSYFIQAENSVPNKYADKQENCEGLSYAYTFARTPFNITGSDNTLYLSFTGAYGLTASYCAKCANLFGQGPRCLVPVVSASCGYGTEPPRHMLISYKSVISVLPDYHLKSKTILFTDPQPLDRCNILFGKIDVTNRLIDFLKPQLNTLGGQVDAKVGTFSLKPMFDQLWKNMAGEYKLGDVGFLYVNPQSVCLSSFSLSGTQLNFSVGLSAKPVVTTVSTPQLVKPLPGLSNYTPANGFNIYLDLLENYDHLTTVVNQQVDGQSAKLLGNVFVVDHVKVYGLGTKIAMEITYSGTNAGVIYLVATPSYDPNTHVLSFPDLAFDLNTRVWALKTAKWMLNGIITDMVKKRATYNFSNFIADGKVRLQSQLSRDMGNNIHTEVTINNLDIQAIYPTAEKLIVRTLSTGQIKVKMVM